MHAIADYVLLLITRVKSLLMSLCNGNNSSLGYSCVSLSEPGGSTVEILLYGGQIVSWKNSCGDQLLCMSSKPMRKSSKISSGGITVCFEQKFHQSDMAAQHGHLRNKVWSTWPPSSQRVNPSWVDLIYLSSQEDMQIWPRRFELRVRVSLSAGKLKLFPLVRNMDRVPFSFSFSLRNYFTVSDISEVRIEGLETLEYIDNKFHRKRATEQADALTFDEEIDRSYLNTPSKLVIIDHGKKRTYVLIKEGLPDAVIWNPSEKCAGAYKTMLSIDSAIFERPVTLQPNQAWRGSQEIAIVTSSYCSGVLDPATVLHSFE